jgi:CBS domain-containing protein
VGGDPASTGVSRIPEIDVTASTDFLGSHAPFDALASDELARIATCAVVEQYESGTVILDAFDSQVDELFIVWEGRVDIWSHRDRFSELPDKTEGAGGLFGYVAALTRAAVAEITDVLVAAGLTHDAHGVSPVNPAFARTSSQWEVAGRAWLSRPAEDNAVVMTCLVVDARPVRGDLSRPKVARVFGDLPLHPSTMKMLLPISIDRSETRRGRWRRRHVDLKRQALLPITNIARWAALSAKSPALQTPERLRAAAGSPMLGAEEADTLADIFELVQRMRLRHQLEQREAGDTPSDTITPRDLSTIEASVLHEAIREILTIQRRMANKSRYVPGLQGAALG